MSAPGVVPTHHVQNHVLRKSPTSEIHFMLVVAVGYADRKAAMAERVGVEPTRRFPPWLISNQLPSATRSPLRNPGLWNPE